MSTSRRPGVRERRRGRRSGGGDGQLHANDGGAVETLWRGGHGHIAPDRQRAWPELYGNAGNNQLTGLGGSDYLVGGLGNDRYYVDASDFIGEEAGGGDDTIFVASSYALRDGVEIETLVAVNQDSLDPVNFAGNEYGQSLYGSQGINSMNGGGGNDYLVGLGGNDLGSGRGQWHLAAALATIALFEARPGVESQ